MLSDPFTYNDNFDWGSCDRIILVLKSIKMRWAVHVELMIDRKGVGLWWGNPKEIENLEDMGGDWRTILKEIFKKWNGGVLD